MITPGTIVFDDAKEEYEVEKMIGNGSFGFVYKILKKSDGSQYALKTLPTSFISQETYDSFINECTMAMKVVHPNVIRYIYVHNGEEYRGLPPYLIMEYANQGTLLDLLEKQKMQRTFFTNDNLKEMYHQLIEGMKAINSLLVHRDIKADNVLIHDGTLKIADFGLAKVADEKTRQITFKGIGHIKYMAPERWRNDKNTIQNDIYSMGILFYELAALRHPYNVKNESDMSSWQEAHTFQAGTPLKQINTEMSNAMVQVINRMMEKNINVRYKEWEEIEKELKIDNIPETSFSAMIDNLVNVKVIQDQAAREHQLKLQKEETERLDHVKRISYQLKQNIYEPLREYIAHFNEKYTGSKITIEDFENLNSDHINIKMRLPSHKNVYLKLKVLYDKDFIKIRETRNFQRSFETVVRPKLYDQLILAWGYFEIHSEQGFNLILVEEQDNIYGKWYLMKNKISALYQKPEGLKEPCAIDFDGLEKAISHLNVFGSQFESEIITGDKFIESVNEIIVQNI